MKKLLDLITGRLGFFLLGAGAFSMVFIAIALTSAFHLQPCPLCVFQRLLYLTLGACLLVGAAWPRLRIGTAALALLASAAGFATAAYQSWMQAFPALFTECSVGVPTNPIEQLVDWLGRLWPWMFYAWGECTSREWELLGLSIANWSAVAFFFFMVVIGWAFYRSVGGRRNVTHPAY